MDRKFFLIFKREYLSRIRQKLFLVTTLLAPLGFLALMLVSVFSAAMVETESYTVYVSDPGGKIADELVKNSIQTLTFQKTDKTLEELKTIVQNSDDKAALVLPADLSKRDLGATFYAPKALSVKLEQRLESKLTEAIRQEKLIIAGIAPEKLADTELNLTLNTKKLDKEGQSEDSSALLAFIFGYIMAFLNYLMVGIYGAIVMKAVVEEKTNRIMEVMISSVKPFQLMLGKILGVGLVGLTQLAIWAVLIVVIMFGFSIFMGASGVGEELAQAAADNAAQGGGATAQAGVSPGAVKQMVRAFHWSLLFYFVFYFVGGFFIYGSLFAAIGSAIDQESDSQQLSSIVSLPFVLPILLLPGIMNNPSGPLAFWFSQIPLFSPVIMMVRLAGGEVAWWEILLSMSLLVLGVIATVWVAARIYRVGALMYGKKTTLKEMARWVLLKN